MKKEAEKKEEKIEKKLVVNVGALIFAVRLKKTRKFFKYFANRSEKNLKKFKKKFGEIKKVLNFATPIEKRGSQNELKKRNKSNQIDKDL